MFVDLPIPTRPCTACGGSGWLEFDPDDFAIECPMCGGSGEVDVPDTKPLDIEQKK